MRQRLYRDGELSKSVKGAPATLRRWLDNLERDWRRNEGAALVGPGEFDPNMAHTVTRVSPDELIVVTTGNYTLRFVNV